MHERVKRRLSSAHGLGRSEALVGEEGGEPGEDHGGDGGGVTVRCELLQGEDGTGGEDLGDVHILPILPMVVLLMVLV